MKSLLLVSFLFCSEALFAQQPGTLDLSFGTKGFVVDNGISTHYAIAQQKDGKLVTAGGYSDTDFNGKGILARFLPDGTIDSSFGVYGFAYYAPESAPSANDMILQEDGKILVVGSLFIQYPVYQNYVGQLKPNGTLDSSFGENGIVRIPDLVDGNVFTRIRQAPDGSIIVSGAGYSDDRQYRYSFLSRVSAAGVFDSKFGRNGRVTNYTSITAQGLAIQKDGKILLAGNTFPGGTEEQTYVLSRYLPDGTPDESFGTGGIVTTEGVEGFKGNDAPGGIVVQPDGRIVIGGRTTAPNFIQYMTALRYNPDGTIDNSFGTKGRSYVAFQGKTPGVSAILLQPDGKLILSGGASNLTESDLALCRFNSDGTVDSSFAIDGKQLTPFSGGDAGAYCALLQQDGKIVQGGSYYNNEQGFESCLLARYNNDSKEQKPLLARIKRFLHTHGIGWQGLDNKNINYYSVQYSTTGSGFSEKGRISGAGSSNFQQYNFNVADAGYYRVVAVDRKGYKTFSNKVMVTEADAASSASVFPNPAQSYVTVQGLKTNEAANISIKNANGNVMVQGVNGGGTQYRSSVSNLQPGTYYMDITTKDKTETLKFVKE